MTENELLKKRPTPEPVGMGSYTIDSHNVRRYITPEGRVQNEGDIGVPTKGPYAIAAGALLPKPGQCDNLLVPVCVSASHIAFGSIRMEPVFMILGQSAATAAVLALEDGVAPQDLPYARLRERLLKDGQILESQDTGGPGPGAGLDPRGLPGVVVDDVAARLTGAWTRSTASTKFIGDGYQHDGDARDGRAQARFEIRPPRSGRYEVRLGYAPNANRSSRVPVDVVHAGGTRRVMVNQRQAPPIDGRFVSLGTFGFTTDALAAVRVSNEGADGYVVIDAVQWLPVE